MDQRLLDEIATAATASPIAEEVGGWWCKAAPEVPFRRCNVALPPADAADDETAFARSLVEVRRWYHGHGRRLIVQVSSAMPGHEQADRWLADAGLGIEAPVHVLVAGRQEPTDGRAAVVSVTTGIDERWATDFGAIHGGTAGEQARTIAYGRLLATFGDRALGATRTVDEQVVGLGFGVLDRGWMGVFGMGTAAGHRRRGVATEVVGALRSAAAARGVDHTYLQVETDNDGAIRLYEGLGFVRSHGYHYRSEPVDGSPGASR